MHKHFHCCCVEGLFLFSAAFFAVFGSNSWGIWLFIVLCLTKEVYAVRLLKLLRFMCQMKMFLKTFRFLRIFVIVWFLKQEAFNGILYKTISAVFARKIEYFFGNFVWFSIFV